MAIPPGHLKNFETLKRAFKSGDVALMECNDSKTGEAVTVICMTNRVEDAIEFVPAARFFNGNPYDELNPPT